MGNQPEVREFIRQLEAQSRRRLEFPGDVGTLLELSYLQHHEEVFRDAIFHAKFVMKTKDVMARIGRGGEGYEKLATEFQNSIDKATTLLKTIVKESPEEVKQPFVRKFFGLDQESFGNLFKLLEDLSWVKNWEVDGKPLPWENPENTRQKSADDKRTESGSIRKSAILGVILMVLFLIIDPPVTYPGWSIAVVVGLLLLYIAVASGSPKNR